MATRCLSSIDALFKCRHNDDKSLLCVVMLIFTPFEKALDSLELALAQPENEFIRDSVIQRFEYSYEVAWKMLRRFLVADLGADALAPLSRKDLFRLAADRKLIDDPLLWFDYHRARNLTSHLYDQAVAAEVYQTAKLFLPQARMLLAELKNRDD